MFREGRPFFNFLVKKVDLHETLAGMVQSHSRTVRGPLFGGPGGSLLGPFFQKYQICVFMLILRHLFSMLIFWSENGASKGGVDMQSDHACACFVRVGRGRLGSILGSILESFWEPSSLLYSSVGALVAETGSQKQSPK